VPGGMPEPHPSEGAHMRFAGYGGSKRDPGLLSRGFPRPESDAFRTFKWKGWEVSDQTGRGFMNSRGHVVPGTKLENEKYLEKVCDLLGKHEGKDAWMTDPDKFKTCAMLADIHIPQKAIERHKRKSTHRDIRYNATLERRDYEALLRPGTKSTMASSNASWKPPFESMGGPQHLGNTRGSLRSGISGRSRTPSLADTHSTLGATRSSFYSRGTGRSSKFSRSSSVISENRALREKNALLERELEQLKGSGSARSLRSFGSIKSKSSQGARALLEAVKNKIYTKNSQLRDAFRAFDSDRSGLVGKPEFEQALKLLGVADGVPSHVLDKLFSMCDPDASGQISYNEFAQKLKRSDVSGQLISDYDYSGEVSGLTHQQREKMRHDQGIM